MQEVDPELGIHNYQEEQEQRYREENIKMIRAYVTAMENIFKRQRNIDDPA